MTTDTPAATTRRRRRGLLVFLRDVLVIVLIAAVVSFVVKTFVVRSFYIPSASMERTLLVNDRILVDELTPRWTGYERGDVVVFKDPGGWLDAMPQTPAGPPLVEALDWVLNFVGISASDSQDHLVKRVIGLPGDHVICCNALGQITINGAPIDELSYLNLPDGDTQASNEPFDVVVPEGSVWLLGDNRDRSRDARAHQDLPSGGFVPLGNIVGKAFLTTWPFDRMGTIDGHHQTFNGVPDPE
ncbi:Signal peptidase I [Microbacterium oxydans]|uniref:Signal peptidase I n=1 Tax=Microbacterium oxydans TaxID=82380 RepID=A0A0F0L5V0_9MICO|nr:signal peptidase I [Microbacterium oxydans]KJL28064.1 Signal peptidase I [Microbacterium oxydans]CAH0123587.1 Signal peptidase I [Microbacterium oxydans]